MGVIRLPLSDPAELMDRYIGEDVIVSGKKIIAKDSLVEPRTVQIARKHGLKDLPVYTPWEAHQQMEASGHVLWAYAREYSP
jgi:hypothetical protein